jgi:Nif11 domain
MSQEKLQAFAEAVSKSENLQKQVALIQMETLRSTAEKVAKLSESAGTPFTAQEYLRSVAESSEQLSAEQLHTVAGGVWEPSYKNISYSIFTFGIGCAMQATRSAAEGDVDKCQFLV